MDILDWIAAGVFFVVDDMLVLSFDKIA